MTMDVNGMNRRRFLVRGATALGGLMLAGCDALSHNKSFKAVINSAEALNERVQPALAGRNGMAREYTKADISSYFKSNGTHYPGTPEYKKLAADNFRNWQLEVGGMIENPMRLTLARIRALPSRTQITRHDCVEGWSSIGEWQGARLSALIERAKPHPDVRYVVFYCYDKLLGQDHYYESIDMAEAFHPQTLLAYNMNGKPLMIPYGAPLRLRLPRQLGYKMAKYLKRIEFVRNFNDINGGNGGFWEDRGYAWYAGI
jgi:DMSO/TMAO reductase YedYZ molybdopterin-dependent catalytic subunit